MDRLSCKAMYYTTKVRDLKGVNPRKWWQEINKLSGAKKQNSNLLCSLNVPLYTGKSPRKIANAINDALLEPLQTFQPLDCKTNMFLHLEENPVFLEVPIYRVYDNLIHLNKHKAPGPDGLTNWILKEYAELLAQPVTNILNSSYREQK